MRGETPGTQGWGQFSPAPVRPSPEYFNGDPRFWNDAKVDWENNCAREKTPWGAKASGIKLSREDLLAKLPEEPRERVEAPGQAKAPEREKMGPEDWLVWARKEYPQQRNERPTSYISRLHGLMEKADNVTYAWKLKTSGTATTKQSKPTNRCTKKSLSLRALFELLRFYACTFLYNCTFGSYIFPPALLAV